MVALDNDLIAKAQKVATGSNTHRIKTLIFEYEEAVIQHNIGNPAHANYRGYFEQLLRAYVSQAMLILELTQERKRLEKVQSQLHHRTIDLLRRYQDAALSHHIKRSA